MSGTRLSAAALLLLVCASGVSSAQPATVDARVTALVGLARTARDQGRAEAAAAYFRDADRLQPFSGPGLVEYFWAAQAAHAMEAMSVGRRALEADPRDARVRDGLIGLAVAAGDETAAARLAEQGRLIEPRAALWVRRLGESHLRSGRYVMGAQQFLAASSEAGAEPGDRAQFAFCLELSGQKAAAARAWAEVPDGLWSSRRDWTESRARALAPAPAPPVRRAEAPALTPAQIEAAQRARLAAEPCAEDPLATLDRLADGEPLVAAVSARRTECVNHAAWTSRAVERLIAAGDFDRALAIARPVAVDGSPVAIREQLGVLLHWTGADAEAAPVLRAVVPDLPTGSRAATAFIEVLRATGDSDAAWTLADRAWRDAPDSALRLGLAELAFETGRLAEALELARALEQDDLLGERAATVEGAALLGLGRAVEARRVLERALPSAAAAPVWMDAVAAIDGVAAALDASVRLPVTSAPAWADVHARRAVWHARLGHTADAARSLAVLKGSDPVRAQIASAEMALAAGRPIEAEHLLRPLLVSRPLDMRALDGLATALAEQGRLDEAEVVLAGLRERRPTEVRWTIREAEWRHRRAPTPDHLQAIEGLARAYPVPEARSALARAYARSGQFSRAVDVLGDVARRSEDDRLVAAKSLRALGRTSDALEVLRTPPVTSVEGQLLAAELDVAVNGAVAADRTFEVLTARSDAEPGWYLAWADLYPSGQEQVRVLAQGGERFPADPILQERLAVTAWAGHQAALAARAADRAIAAAPSRPGAWFVKIELASGESNRDAVLTPLLDRFETRFGVEADARVGVAEMLAGLTRSPGDPAAARALSWMNERLARDPRDIPARVARARLLVATGEVARALAVVDALVLERPELPSALKLRAELLGTSGRYTEAVDAYDRYLAVAPDDLAARRQQARVEGWRGAYGASQGRYEALVEREPGAKVIAAEAEAKEAYYSGNWTTAASRYDRWLALDPQDVEAQLERAQLYDRLGQPARAVDGFHAVTASAAPNDVATTAARRIERRRETRVDLFANGQSADAAERQQLLDLVDSGVGIADDLGLGYLTRARLFAGPSWAEGDAGPWHGYHAGLEMSTALATPLRLGGSVAYRKLDAFDASWFGDLGLTWRIGSRLRVTGGAQRSLLLENASTLSAGTFGVGPTVGARWTPTSDFSLDANASRWSMSDDNLRRALRVAVSQRILRGRNEVRLVGITDGLGFRDERPTYFTPSSFWRVDGGAEWRGWLAMPRFFGDRERWLSAGYTYGMDDRDVRYHTARAGFSYELTGGMAFVMDGQITRSLVYNAGRLTFGLRLKQVAVPEP